VARRPLLPLALSFAGVVACVLPWRVYVAVHHLPIADYRFSDLLSWSYLSAHADRVGPAFHGLASRVFLGGWGLVPVAVLVVLAAGLAARRLAATAFAALWLALSFLGLVAIYWIDRLPVQMALAWSSARTVTSLVLGGAAIAPLLAAEAWRTSSAVVPAEASAPAARVEPDGLVAEPVREPVGVQRRGPLRLEGDHVDPVE
jgi:hypothetical protein